jgi:chromosome segregation ATPase
MCWTRLSLRSMSPSSRCASALLTGNRKQAVTTQTQELEALEARLRATEERLNQAKEGNSPPRRKDSHTKTPLQSTFSEQDTARLGAASPLAQKTANMPGALPQTPTPTSTTSADYVLVERPRSAQPVDTETT